jgi:hypothetical protein
VLGHVQALAVRRDGHAVGLLHVGQQQRDLTVGVDAVDAPDRLLYRLVADVARVGHVHATGLVDSDVIEAVERLAVEEARHKFSLARVEVGADDRAAAEVGAQCQHHAALPVELHSVGAATGRAEDGGLVGLGVVLHDVPHHAA